MRISKASFQTNKFPGAQWVWKLLLLQLLLATLLPVLANSSLVGEGAVTNLRWKPGVIRVSISASLLRENPNIKHDSDVAGAIKRSIETWSQVTDVDLRQAATDRLSASPSGPAGDGVSLITIAPTPENVLLFAKDPEGSAATTRVFYNRRGIITEADIVLNPYQQFSTDGTIGTFDLESTLTHEIGHLLGLSHSDVLGATMHANYAKNGVFGLPSLTSRSLGAADIAAIRAAYGVRGEDTECCGRIEGHLSFLGRQNRNVEVWVEDYSGRVYGSTKVATTGEFAFGGLNRGKYRLFALEKGAGKNVLPAQEISLATVSTGETTTVTARAAIRIGDLDLSYLGFNGQLSEMAVSLSPGRSYTVYLGGRNLDPKDLTVRFSSPNLSAVPGTIRSLDYGDDISVVSVEVRVSPRTVNGEYSIFAESRSGDRRAVIGGLTVDNYANSFASLATFND